MLSGWLQRKKDVGAAEFLYSTLYFSSEIGILKSYNEREIQKLWFSVTEMLNVFVVVILP